MGVVTPYLSAPSTPKNRFGDYFFSAPTSPRRISEFYKEFDDVSLTRRSVAAVPFDWEEKPGTPKSTQPNTTSEDGDDFAFDVSEETEKSRILPAEELFDCGKIRPLKPPPQIKLRSETGDSQIWRRSPVSDGRGVFSPRKKKEFDPVGKGVADVEKRAEKEERGRERVSSLSSSNSGRRGTRSVSPYRVSKYPWEEQQQQQQQQTENTSILSKTPAFSPSSSKSKRKWRLRDFFLFRSASEGRAADRDPLRKYTAFFRRRENVKYSSFKSVEGSDSGSSLRRRGQVSAHELHYTANRAVSEDLKKKTFLPYKQGILGRLAFNPAVHALANGFGFSRK
ncbi:hypothetical protein Vadar_017409 [Vaccinium darrowii]|uniref:Uncharacterized protein n=1 Tax=Vaccinium darrowii TaxID=229202 RepID=A0ACB7Y057_9ERIC|nr:hypothetical protein Vadar_017409 [Vaccinium darrowii]